jgi:hypothetical protein
MLKKLEGKEAAAWLDKCDTMFNAAREALELSMEENTLDFENPPGDQLFSDLEYATVATAFAQIGLKRVPASELGFREDRDPPKQIVTVTTPSLKAKAAPRPRPARKVSRGVRTAHRSMAGV